MKYKIEPTVSKEFIPFEKHLTAGDYDIPVFFLLKGIDELSMLTLEKIFFHLEEEETIKINVPHNVNNDYQYGLVFSIEELPNRSKITQNDLEELFQRINIRMFSYGRYTQLQDGRSGGSTIQGNRSFDNFFQSYSYELKLENDLIYWTFFFDDSTR